jgi:predicted  nucleic acid-binding Zn-ribbon protein
MHDIELEIDRIPGQITELEDEISNFRREFDEASSRLNQLNKSCREKEAELSDLQQHITDRESKLYMIKTNKEYQAAVTEIAERKRHNKELGDEILAFMEEIETLESYVKEQKPLVDAKAQEEAEDKSKLESTMGELKKELTSKQMSWKEQTKGIDKEFLEKYEAARRMNSDVIAILERNTCQGCYMSVPPQLVIEVLRLESLHSCPNCQRLLFIKEAIEDQGIETPIE